MKTTIKYVAPWMAAAAIGGAVSLAPIASAATLAAPPATATAACALPAHYRLATALDSS